MARGWHYTKLLNMLVLCSFLFVDFVLLLFCFDFMLTLELCRCSSDIFPVQQTTNRIGSHGYYWV